MSPLIITLALATFVSTLIGGIVVLRFRSSLPFFFAFAAGSLMGVAFLDILPESLRIAEHAHVPARHLMVAIVLSFFFYHLVERFFVTHHIENDEPHGHIMGPIGAGSLVIHSFLDGAAIGAAFQVSASIGVVVALAVIFHDFNDGINTVTLMLKNDQPARNSMVFLLLDAVAPLLGVFTVSLIAFPEDILAFVLAMFVGEFLYIGAANLLPETRQYHSRKILLATAAGVVLIYGLTMFI